MSSTCQHCITPAVGHVALIRYALCSNSAQSQYEIRITDFYSTTSIKHPSRLSSSSGCCLEQSSPNTTGTLGLRNCRKSTQPFPFSGYFPPTKMANELPVSTSPASTLSQPGGSGKPRTRQRVYKAPPPLEVPDIDQDAAERKRVLNVLAQRRYRE